VDGNIPNQTGEFTSFTSFTLNSGNASLHTGQTRSRLKVYNDAFGTPDVTGIECGDFERYCKFRRSRTGFSRVPGPWFGDAQHSPQDCEDLEFLSATYLI